MTTAKQEKDKHFTDETLNKNWRTMIAEFKLISEKGGADCETKLLALKERANTEPLSDRQRDGIRARCDYAIEIIKDPSKERKPNLSRSLV